MSKKALIILANGFEEIEAITVIDLLRRAEINTTIAGLQQLEITGAHNIRITCDKILTTEINNSYDCIVLPGGMPGTTNLAASKEVITLIQNSYKNNALICAICAAPALVLSKSGILDNKKATCYPSMEKYFTEKTIFINGNVVVDGNIITSRGPATAFNFALSIIEKLCGNKVSSSLAGQTLYN